MRGFSPSCRLVNTRPAKPHREHGSKLRVFVWVYDYGIFVCKLKRKKKRKSSRHFTSENNFVLGHTWKLRVFFPSLIPIRSSFFSPALVFDLAGVERENREVPAPEYKGRAGQGREAAKLRTPEECTGLQPCLYGQNDTLNKKGKERKGKQILPSAFYCNQNHPEVPSEPSGPALIVGTTALLG